MGIKIRSRRVVPARSRGPWVRVQQALVLLGIVVVVGVAGYRVIGLSTFDALYQTAITVTTVGYGEIGPVEEIDKAYRWFTLFLVFFGVGAALYTLGVLVEALVEGSLNNDIRLRKERRMIDKLSGHIIIAGGGRVSAAIATYAVAHDAQIVVIDKNGPDGRDHIVLHGDATDDETLIEAGIRKASTLVAALSSDAANIYVTLSARALNPDLLIVARTDHRSNEAKFFRAGADRVVNPYDIGGSRMGALVMHPALAEFLNGVLNDESHDVEIVEITASLGSTAIGLPLSDIRSALDPAPLVLAVRCGLEYDSNPAADRVIQIDDVLIALGNPAEISALKGFVN